MEFRCLFFLRDPPPTPPNQSYCWEAIVCHRGTDNLLPGRGMGYHRQTIWNNDTQTNNNAVAEGGGERTAHKRQDEWVTAGPVPVTEQDPQRSPGVEAPPQQPRLPDVLLIGPLSARLRPPGARHTSPDPRPAVGLHSPDQPSANTRKHQPQLN